MKIYKVADYRLEIQVNRTVNFFKVFYYSYIYIYMFLQKIDKKYIRTVHSAMQLHLQ